MWSWRSSSSKPEVGWELSLWGAGVVLSAFAFGALEVVPPWAWLALSLGAVASFSCALLTPRRLVFWFFLGFCLAGALTLASGPTTAGEERQPVRFSGVVRDGFRPVETGWSTRLRVLTVEGPSGPENVRRELSLTVGGSASPENLPPPGSRVEGAGELVQRGKRQSLWVKTPRLLQLQGHPGGVDAFREEARWRLVETAGFSLHRQRAATLAAALVLGRREQLLEEETQTLRQAGLGHLLAVSGLHVGLVAGLFWTLFLLLGLSPRTRRWLLIPVVVGFAWLSGGAPPVRRAAGAAVLLLVARQLGRPLELLPTFWGVVGLLVLVEPGLVWDVGFELSAGIALALVRFLPELKGLFGGGRFGTAVSVAAVAQVASLPLSGLHFGMLPPLGMVCNLLAVPVATVMVGLSLAALALACVFPPLAGLCLDGVGFGASVLQLLAGWGAKVLWAFPPLPWGLQAFLLLLFVAALLPWRGALGAALGVVVMTGFLVARAYLPPSQPQVAMLPVRQGMALLVSGREGRLLVDAGRASREALGALAWWRGAKLDALVLTHPDADHVGGAEAVVSVLRPRFLMLPALFWQRSEFLSLRWQAEKRGVAVVPLFPGQRVRVGDVACDVLWPPAQGNLPDNDASLVLRCGLAGVSFLLVGDLESTGEERLLASAQPVFADILQVGHHGSRTSTSWAFLKAVSPRLALIPTGTSPHLRFPQPVVVSRLRQARVLVLSQKQGFKRLWVGQEGDLELDTSPPVFVRVGGD
ncbi:MAG: DNA internalization-related competence protein ComEC/Rec2 [Thermoanaerobaculum sp.]|nr:MAG: DNA internalization-related competence protein ComEC/Rec2 [Thermoanaerobaculum sp.]